jgi:hypothetical protein
MAVDLALGSVQWVAISFQRDKVAGA